VKLPDDIWHGACFLIWCVRISGNQTMDKNKPDLSEETGFSVSGQADTFMAGEAMLARAKSVSQRIADRVRELTQETQTDVPDDATDEHRPLAQ
jgi:hypothetical protein